jgi:hypothetical protein
VGRKTVAGVAAWVVLGVGAVALAHSGHDATIAAVANPLPIPTVPATPVLAVPAPAPTPTACTTAHGPFRPTGVELPGISDGVPILPMHRDADGVPGVPPISEQGKNEMAFDLGSGIEPGAAAGNALLNAHTWPDGSALGNKLLDGLHKGDRIIVKGALGQLCYRVNDRVEVPADDDGKRYFARTGAPQIALIVCSGRRLGPGHWTMRTIWYASPVS